jgi:hypothetical protein
MMRVRGYSLAEAKQIVHSSDGWADQRVAHEEFHERLARALVRSAVVEGECLQAVDWDL